MAVLSVDALPVGFRFRPTDVELVDHYLKRKINYCLGPDAEVIPDIDICKFEPWELPGKYLIKTDDPEWFFFSPKVCKYSNGNRSNRATKAGYWKATGRDRMIKLKSQESTLIGTKKTLVFYRGRAPDGNRTNWVMHEYRMTEPEFESRNRGGFVLCRLFDKSGDRTLTSEVDVITERNIDEIESSMLSPIVTRPSLAETLLGGDAIVEGLTSVDQILPQSNMQADLQNMHEDCSKNEVDAHGSETSVLLEELALQFSPLDPSNFVHINFPMDACMEFSMFDGFHNGLQPDLSQSSNTEEDFATKFLDSILCDPEESLPEMSNDNVPEGQKCMIDDHSVYSSVLSKESMALNNEDVGATSGQEDIGLLEASDGRRSYPRHSSDISNCVPHMQEDKSQVTYGQNSSTLDYSAVPLCHDLSATTKPTMICSSDLSSNMEKETTHANLDNTGIQIRARQKSSPENFIEHQGLAMRRVRLQKSVFNVSVAGTGNESIRCCENVHKSIISEVRKYEKQLVDEGTINSVSGYGDNVGETSGSNIQSISCQELPYRLKSTSGSISKRWTSENAGKFKGPSAYRTGSYSAIGTVILVTFLLLLFVVISWLIVH